MPFQQEYDRVTRTKRPNRDRTGPPPPPETGTVRAADGTIVADSATIDIPPPTPVNVDQPSPSEPLIDGMGRITPRWWRYLDQIYRRTGGVVDNINRVPTSLLGPDFASTVAMTLTGQAPTILNPTTVSAGSMAITGTTPSVLLRTPPSASLTLTGNVPTIS